MSNVGTFDSATSKWELDTNGNGLWEGCAIDTCVTSFGQPGDLPVTRHLSGLNGTIIGVFQPQTTITANGKTVTKRGYWRFDLNANNSFDNCSTDECADFGGQASRPVVGDWAGTGSEEIGIFRPRSGEWYLDYNGNGKLNACGVDKCLGPFGETNDLPVAGDWDGTGQVRIGVFRPSTGKWFLDLNGNGKLDSCTVDACLGPFGQPGDLPVVGKW